VIIAETEPDLPTAAAELRGAIHEVSAKTALDACLGSSVFLPVCFLKKAFIGNIGI